METKRDQRKSRMITFVLLVALTGAILLFVSGIDSGQETTGTSSNTQVVNEGSEQEVFSEYAPSVAPDLRPLYKEGDPSYKPWVMDPLPVPDCEKGHDCDDPWIAVPLPMPDCEKGDESCDPTMVTLPQPVPECKKGDDACEPNNVAVPHKGS